MLDASELTQARSDAATLLDLDCTIRRPTSSRGGAGSRNRTGTTTIATVKAGMKQPSASIMQNYDDMLGSLSVWQVKMPYGTSVLKQDELLIADKVLTVQVDLTTHSYAMYTMVLASEVL